MFHFAMLHNKSYTLVRILRIHVICQCMLRVYNRNILSFFFIFLVHTRETLLMQYIGTHMMSHCINVNMGSSSSSFVYKRGIHYVARHPPDTDHLFAFTFLSRIYTSLPIYI